MTLELIVFNIKVMGHGSQFQMGHLIVVSDQLPDALVDVCCVTCIASDDH